MSDIFISYASEDMARAEQLAGLLSSEGWKVWWDRKIPPGCTFDDVIDEAINAAKCVIVLWSEKSVSSNWVRNEAAEGNRRGILIPVLIDNVIIPLAFRHIEAAKLIGWHADQSDPEWNGLVASIEDLIGKATVSVDAVSYEKQPEVINQPADKVGDSSSPIDSADTQSDTLKTDVSSKSQDFSAEKVTTTLKDKKWSIIGNITLYFIIVAIVIAILMLVGFFISLAR